VIAGTAMLDELDGFTLWDGQRDRGAMRISWSGDRIESVDPAQGRHPGLAVIPGLVDTHVHLDTNAVNGAGRRRKRRSTCWATSCASRPAE
jgi:cytosine/adenosine deaminase-related metal-dependent hydrolase